MEAKIEDDATEMPESVAYNVNCMDYLRTVPDKAFDLAVVDPPYGIENGFHATSRIKNMVI